MNKVPLLTIGQLARHCGVTVETIRFYEKQGLIDPPGRTPSGYRQYPPEDRKRLNFILKAKELGFSLKDIGDLLHLRDGDSACGDIRDLARSKISEIDQRITALQEMKTALCHLETQCAGSANRDCPIVNALEQSSAWGTDPEH